MDRYSNQSSFDKGDIGGEIGEQGAPASGGGGGGTKAPYPTVTKWSSKRKFGPTYNPEQKVWTLGTARGPGNTLL